MKITLVAAAALMATAAMQSPAATFYKYTDATGRVTYVDRPPANAPGPVEVLTVDPDANTATLPDAVITEPQTEAERIIRNGQAERLTEAKAADLEVEAARGRVLQARSALQGAQDNSVAEDWIYLANKRRIPRPEYAARLDSLDQQVKAAEANLAEAERQQRLAY